MHAAQQRFPNVERHVFTVDLGDLFGAHLGIANGISRI